MLGPNQDIHVTLSASGPTPNPQTVNGAEDTVKENSMESTTLIVKDVIGNTCAALSAQGQALYRRIEDAMDRGLRVEVSFEGITTLTTTFLNIAMGQLYSKFTPAMVAELFSADQLDPGGAAALALVLDNAKQYFAMCRTGEPVAARFNGALYEDRAQADGNLSEPLAVSVRELIGTPYCTEQKDARIVFDYIVQPMNEGRHVVLSFRNIIEIVDKFFETAIGSLYAILTPEEIKERLTVELEFRDDRDSLRIAAKKAESRKMLSTI